jgi:hypothetical protein
MSRSANNVTDFFVLLEELLKDAGLRRKDDLMDFVLTTAFNFEGEVDEQPTCCKALSR